MNKKICHITTVHSPFDIRVFHKECRTLAKTGYDVMLVARHERNETIEGIKIIALPPAKNKITRMAGLAFTAFRIALRQDAALYHIHDPELVPYGIVLKWLGKKVVYDAHEDWPRNILTKDNIPTYFRHYISWLFERMENFAVKRFDAVIAATPFIRERFSRMGCAAENVNNYPLRGELRLPAFHTTHTKKRAVCYLGLISEIRGIHQMLLATDQAGVALLLAGPFYSHGLCERLKMKPEWRKVEYLGQIDREEVARVLSESMAGLVLFHPVPNHINAQPNKFFEYMSAGIPVIASNFPLWKEIVEGNQCGICVDPMKPQEIAEAILKLVDYPDEAARMGENGRRAVEEKYNWEKEKQKLIDSYERLLREN